MVLEWTKTSQVILLERRRDPRALEGEKEVWEKPPLRTIKAIAAKMRVRGEGEGGVRGKEGGAGREEVMRILGF